MSSVPVKAKIKSVPETSGDARKLTARMIEALLHGEMDRGDAAVAAKLIEGLNDSLYSEIKYAGLLHSMGQKAPEIGMLRLYPEGAAK